MNPAAALSPAAYAELSALYDELSECEAPDRQRRLAALREAGHPLVGPLSRMLAALQGPRTDELLPQWAPPRDEALWLPGRRVGPWRLLSRLGQGGMAEVWLACRDDGGLKREVALKLPHAAPGPLGALRAQRFERERDILSALRHPHIAALLDAAVEPDGQAWMALEHVEGQPITAWCDAQRASVAQRVALFRQVLLAVQHAHAELVIHRDIKPSNVLVTAQGEVRLLDFGIAKLLDAQAPVARDSALTQEGGHPLTPLYASPEQLRGQALSTSSDVYSLGVLLHELLTGRLPHQPARPTAAEMERCVLEDEVPLPSSQAPDAEQAAARGCTPKALRRQLAPELDAVLLRALAREPAQRYRTVDALLADIDRWCAGVPVQARTPSAWFRARRFVARHRLGVGLGLAVVAGLAGLSAVAIHFGLQARAESQRAGLSRNLLLDVFGKADVDATRGADISARDMLDWGRRRAAALAAPVALRADLLMDIGRAQSDATDYAGAARSFAEAQALMREAGRGAGELEAAARQAELALRLGDLAGSERHLQQARAAAQGLRGGPEPALAARLAFVDGLHQRHSGRLEAAAAQGELAAASVTRAGLAADELGINVAMFNAELQAARGRPEQALQQLDALQARLQAAQVDEPRIDASIEEMRADIESDLGHYGRLVRRLDTALPRCEQRIGARYEVCGALRHALALALLRTGDSGAAVRLLPALQDEAARTDQVARRSRAWITQARILAAAGQVQAEAAPWPALGALARGEVAEAADADFRATAWIALAEGALARGQPGEVLQAVQALRSLLPTGEATGGDLASRLRLHAQALACVAHTRLALGAGLGPGPERTTVAPRGTGGRGPSLDAALAECLPLRGLGERSIGPRHVLTWLYALNAVPALRAAQRGDEAQALIDQALPLLREQLGAEAPRTASISRWRQPTTATPAAAVGPLL